MRKRIALLAATALVLALTHFALAAEKSSRCRKTFRRRGQSESMQGRAPSRPTTQFVFSSLSSERSVAESSRRSLKSAGGDPPCPPRGERGQTTPAAASARVRRRLPRREPRRLSYRRCRPPRGNRRRP